MSYSFASSGVQRSQIVIRQVLFCSSLFHLVDPLPVRLISFTRAVARCLSVFTPFTRWLHHDHDFSPPSLTSRLLSDG